MAGGGRTPNQQCVATAEGEHLRGRRVRDTKPEVALRKAVHRLGLRFRLHKRVAPRCTADFVLPRYHLAVFVDGCFWHGCPDHSPAKFRGPNAALWQEKIEANKKRDRRDRAGRARRVDCGPRLGVRDSAGRPGGGRAGGGDRWHLQGGAP
ncbi:hypothetical protein ACFWHW_12225 [Streptomyces pharetrae]|uniref:hypothetical protein n=1 Tax=Streptomyces pharetrae TaxID=291370 RepID=UPI00365F9653